MDPGPSPFKRWTRALVSRQFSSSKKHGEEIQPLPPTVDGDLSVKKPLTQSKRYPSDIGPNANAKHREQNRVASGISQLPTNRTVSESVSQSSNNDAPSHRAALMLLEEQWDPNDTEAFPGEGEVPYLGPQMVNARPTEQVAMSTDLRLEAASFPPISRNGEIVAECAAYVEFPLFKQAHETPSSEIAFAFVVDNSAYSSPETWTRITQTIVALFQTGVITSSDTCCILCTDPIESHKFIIRSCGIHTVREIQADLQSIRLINGRPTPTLLDVAVSRATEHLLEMWHLSNCPNTRYGHILVFTANPSAVRIEFLPATRPQRRCAVYVICASGLPYPSFEANQSWCSEAVQAQIDLKPLYGQCGYGSSGAELISDISSLVSLIRTARLPRAISNIRLSVGIETTFERPGPSGIAISRTFHELTMCTIPILRPGEKISKILSFHLTGDPSHEYEASSSKSLLQAKWTNFVEIHRSPTHRIVVRIEHQGPTSNCRNSKSVSIRKNAKREDVSSSACAAYYQAQAARLLKSRNFTTCLDLLAYAEDWTAIAASIKACLVGLSAEAKHHRPNIALAHILMGSERENQLHNFGAGESRQQQTQSAFSFSSYSSIPDSKPHTPPQRMHMPPSQSPAEFTYRHSPENPFLERLRITDTDQNTFGVRRPSTVYQRSASSTYDDSDMEAPAQAENLRPPPLWTAPRPSIENMTFRSEKREEPSPLVYEASSHQTPKKHLPLQERRHNLS